MRRRKKKIYGSKSRPRLSVFKSLKHIYAQAIDDLQGKTLVSSSSLEEKLGKKIKYGGNITAAASVGEEIAKLCLAAGIKKVVFNRGKYLYHGRLKALADAARKAGLEF